MSDEIESGSGLTTSENMGELLNMAEKQYAEQLAGFVGRGRSRGSLTKKQADEMKAAFRDGMATMLAHLKGMGIVRILTDDEVKALRQREAEAKS